MGKVKMDYCTLFTTTEQWIQLICDFSDFSKEEESTQNRFFNRRDGVGVHNVRENK